MRLLSVLFAFGIVLAGDSTDYFKGLEFRSIGPYRGGRSAAVTGVAGQPLLAYFGSTGGGVWRTTDGGSSWKNISDGFFGGSIGAVAVSESDPNVIYVGGGEKTVRGNVSHGYGVWRSLDAGRSWVNVGLNDTRHVPRIRIHPKDHNLVYVAAMGHLFGPNEERGVFRSKDGGNTWEKILFINNEVGIVDLLLHPSNPRWVFATAWRVKRTPYSLDSGGPDSGLWFSPDGGDTWQDWSKKKGLPEGPLGIIGVSASAADPDRLWAMIEAKDGGLFRSDDFGKSWTKVNESRDLRQRAWYYTRVYADPVDADTVYVMNVQFWKSKDGGKSFSSFQTPHGDHHDLWIDPLDPDHLIVGDDGGAQVSFDGAQNWSTYHNQPTAQFYRVTTDNHFPYRIYGAQQDNSTVRIFHRSSGSSIGEDDWERTAGGESGHIAPHPENPDIVYGGSYGGFLTRLDHRTGALRLIDVWPRNPMGHGAKDLKYRFQWNFPIFFSPHDANILYAAGNHLFKTTNEGQSWEEISPDLTRNNPSTLGSSGGPITQDNTSVEYYATIFAALESPHEAGVLWAGSDDGLIHVSRDGGVNWDNVTPKDMPDYLMINGMEAHPTEKGSLYIAATGYKSDDFRPYLYKTENYGKSWKKIVTGINPLHFTRAIRCAADGILFAGTESGLYVSLNDGKQWQSFQNNLPIVPITDLAIKDQDLIVATQGRSFWVLDDISPLLQWKDQLAESPIKLFKPRNAYRLPGRVAKNPSNAGTNAPNGPVFSYWIKDAWEKDDKDKFTKKLTLEIMDEKGEKVISFNNQEKPELPSEQGLNRFVWNMRLKALELPKGMILWTYSGRGGGIFVPPGTYQARLTSQDYEETVSFEILKDPRSETTQDQFQDQFNFLSDVVNTLEKTNQTVGEAGRIQSDLKNLKKVLNPQEHAELLEQINALLEKLEGIETKLYQTKNKSRQDPLNFPIQLNDQLAGLITAAGLGDWQPTQQTKDVFQVLKSEIDQELQVFQSCEADLAAINQAYRDLNLPLIWFESPKKEEANKSEE